MKIQQPQLPTPTDRFSTALVDKLGRILRDIVNQLNALSEGGVSAVTNAYTAAPTGGTYSQGDFVLNSKPSVLGPTGSMYIVTGWTCVQSGGPGLWVECRVLTGG